MFDSPLSASAYEVLGVAPEASDDELRRAFRAGKRSGATNVDADVAAARWERRNCSHRPGIVCALEHAWWDGFGHDGWEDSLPDYMR